MARPKGSKNKARTVKASVDYAAVVAEKTAEKEKIESEVATKKYSNFRFFSQEHQKRVVGFLCFRFHNLIYGIGYFFRRSRNGGFSGFSNFHKKRHSSPFFHKFFLHNLWIL